jgi:hypothetical protein
MKRVIRYITTLVIFFSWMSISYAQSDPKNTVQNIKSVNPSKFDHPLNQPDTKLTPEQRTAIENADHSNPTKPPSAAPDQKKTTANPETEIQTVTPTPEPNQAPPEMSSSPSKKMSQPEGEKPASVTDYRALKGPTDQPAGEIPPVKDRKSQKK